MMLPALFRNHHSIDRKDVAALVPKQTSPNVSAQLALFHSAAQSVPAYKNFLAKQQLDPTTIKTAADFLRVPVMTKENYIDVYPMQDRVFGGTLRSVQMISTSSGTTGNVHFWPRNDQDEMDGAKVHEQFLNQIWQIDKKLTLFIDAFAMGNWIAGTFTLACLRLVANKGYPLVTMTPGYSLEAVLPILRQQGPNFEQIVIAGHVPFLKEIVDSAIAEQIDLASMHIKLLGTGQGITEAWREHILHDILKTSDPYAIVNLYGSADASLMGFETQRSIIIRSVLSKNPAGYKQVFADERLPSLYNFDPHFTYIESINRELHITKQTACPLIRYNIQDTGGVIEPDAFQNQLLAAGVTTNVFDSLPFGNLPFVYLFGRDKFMAKIYGANVYTEHVQHALGHQALQPHITGQFLLSTDYDAEHNPQLICRVELNIDQKASPELEQKIADIFVDEVKQLNSEYKFIIETMGDKARPKVYLHDHGDPRYFPKNVLKKTA